MHRLWRQGAYPTQAAVVLLQLQPTIASLSTLHYSLVNSIPRSILTVTPFISLVLQLCFRRSHPIPWAVSQKTVTTRLRGRFCSANDLLEYSVDSTNWVRIPIFYLMLLKNV